MLGTVVALSKCVGGTDQGWILAPTVSAPAPNGARVGQIRYLTNECLDLPHSNTVNGALIDLQTCDGSLRQQWKGFGGDPNQITGNLGKCFDPNGEAPVVAKHPTAELTRPAVIDWGFR